MHQKFNMLRERSKGAVLVAIISAIFFALPVFASTTIGTIDTVNKNVWGSKIGWVNFYTTNGDVQVNDAGLIGSVWSDLYGWIRLDPTKSGVKNDGYGNLSGYAWGTNLGWIDFANVKINSSGIFTGYATGDNVGTLNFDCDNCKVQTDWRPRSGRPQCNNSLDDDNDGKTDYPADPGCENLTDTNEMDLGGGSLPVGATVSPAPTPAISIHINNDEPSTNNPNVSLNIYCGTAKFVWYTEDPLFGATAARSACSGDILTTIPFILSDGEGQKTVFARFCNDWGYCGTAISANINYVLSKIIIEPTPTTTPAVIITSPATSATTTPLTVFDRLKNLGVDILNFVSPLPTIGFNFLEVPLAKLFTEQIFPTLQAFSFASAKIPSVSLTGLFDKTASWNLPEISLTKIIAGIRILTPSWLKPQIVTQPVVTKECPLAMKGKWELISKTSVNKYVFAPLPKEFIALANKFPSIKNTFQQVNLSRLSDVRRIQNVKLFLPSISQAVGLATTSLSVAQEIVPKGIPVTQLSANLKQKIPSEVIFARAAGELVDFNIAVTLSDQGKLQEKITTISGKTMHLAVRPSGPVNSVTGYIVFKSRSIEAKTIPLPLPSLFQKIVFAEPVFAESIDESVTVENRLVLKEFAYVDPDKDGIFTADIDSPVSSGEYEVITVIDYIDPDVGRKEIRMLAVVDPEGYVYERIKGQELRISGAVVTLFRFNFQDKKFAVWPANEYQQENPQTTDVRGSYSFLVPGGTYYLRVESPGYQPYESKQFIVEEGGGVHMNIELSTGSGWLKNFDWKTGLIIVIALLLLYNFYQDKKRKLKR